MAINITDDFKFPGTPIPKILDPSEIGPVLIPSPPKDPESIEEPVDPLPHEPNIDSIKLPKPPQDPEEVSSPAIPNLNKPKRFPVPLEDTQIPSIGDPQRLKYDEYLKLVTDLKVALGFVLGIPAERAGELISPLNKLVIGDTPELGGMAWGTYDRVRSLLNNLKALQGKDHSGDWEKKAKEEEESRKTALKESTKKIHQSYEEIPQSKRVKLEVKPSSVYGEGQANVDKSTVEARIKESADKSLTGVKTHPSLQHSDKYLMVRMFAVYDFPAVRVHLERSGKGGLNTTMGNPLSDNFSTSLGNHLMDFPELGTPEVFMRNYDLPNYGNLQEADNPDKWAHPRYRGATNLNNIQIVEFPLVVEDITYGSQSSLAPLNILGRNLQKYHFSNSEDTMEMKIFWNQRYDFPGKGGDRVIDRALKIMSFSKRTNGVLPHIHFEVPGTNGHHNLPLLHNTWEYVLEKAPIKIIEIQFNRAAPNHIKRPLPVRFEQTLTFKRVARVNPDGSTIYLAHDYSIHNDPLIR